MKPCASPLALLLIFALAMPALPARAAANCKESRALDSLLASSIGQRSYLKACERAVAGMSAAFTKAQQIDSVQGADIKIQGGQAGSAQGASDMSGAGAASQQQRAQLASQASSEYRTVAVNLQKTFDDFAKKDAPLIDRLSAPSKSRIAAQAEKALNQELRGLYEMSMQQSGSLSQKAQQFNSSAAQLGQYKNQNQLVVERLGGGNNNGSSGVGSGTWVALGGAAIIAAGTVGGIAYFTNRGIDKLDKVADKKIEKLEETAKRLIEFASDKANKVLADAEKTTKKILEQAKKDGKALVQILSSELQEQFVNLSDIGLEKLRTEMQGVFADAIANAKNSGDKALEETLSDARDKTLGKITDEIERRTGKEQKSTVSSTSTSTTATSSTETATATASSSATATESSSATATATASSSATQTQTNSGYSTVTATSSETGTVTIIRE